MKTLSSLVILLTLSASITILTTHASASESAGNFCNIEHTPTSIRKWGINVYDLATGERQSVFGVGNNRKIQSVACNHTGSIILFTMQDAPRGEYDVYALLNKQLPPIRITENDVDDLHVTMDKQGMLASWQTELSDGRQVIKINKLKPDGSYIEEKTMGSAYPYLQPSLSQNGKWLVFIQLRKSAYLIFRYSLSTGKFTEVQRTPRRKRSHHPSISDDGNLVSFSEGKNQNKLWVKDLKLQTKYPQVNDANGIEHAMLSGDGQSFMYSLNIVSAERQVHHFIREAMSSIPLGSSLEDPDRFLGNYVSKSLYQPLSDTGVTDCVDPDDWWSADPDCSALSGQDNKYGRDFEYNDDSDGFSGFSYTKIDSNGNSLAADASSWSCVRDNINGLIWQVKLSKNNVIGDQGFRDSDDRFSWYNSDSAGNGGNEGFPDQFGSTCFDYDVERPETYCNTEAYVNRINQAGYCGLNNWRMPSRNELVSIINYGNKNAAADLVYFNDVDATVSDLHIWSRDSKASHPEGAWNVDFFNGNYFIYDKGEAHSIRLVSGG